MTVRMFQPPPVSAAHATLAQLFFSTVVSIAVFTSAWWNGKVAEVNDPGTPGVRSLAVWTWFAVFLQLILGAAFRHKGFGIIPHLIGAVVVTILIFMTAGALKRRFSDVPALRSCAKLLHMLIGVQLLLGGGAYWSRLYAAHFPQPIPVMVALTVIHTVTGALVLAGTLVTVLTIYRLVPARTIAQESATREQVA
jgi:cytochrome c oxidase assembly protein subunit 15